MKPCIRVIDCANFLDKTLSSVLTLALDRKVKVMVPIHQMVKAIEKLKLHIVQIDKTDLITSAMSEIWEDRVYFYYLEQKKSSWPSREELRKSYCQLASGKNYELEDVRKSEDKYLTIPKDSLQFFIEGAKEVKMDVFYRVEKPAENDIWSGKVWFFESEISVGLDWLVIFKEDQKRLTQMRVATGKKLWAMDVDKSNYHLWFIEDYLDKNLSNEKVSFRDAWEELRKNADKEKIEHPYQNQNSWFKFRRETKALWITEHYENSDKLASNEEKEADSNQKKLLKLDAFRKAFDRKCERRNQLMLEHKE